VTQSIYDAFALSYDSSTLQTPYFSHLNSRYREILIENHPKFFVSPILDLGCGTGLFTEVISHGTTYYIGVDLSWKMLGIAQTKSLERGKTAERSFLRADASHLPLKADSVGAVVSVGMVLPHLHSYEEGLIEISRILRRTGQFLIELDNKWSVDLLHYFADAATAGKIFSYGFSSLHQISRYVKQDEYEWDAMLDGAAIEGKVRLHKISIGRLKHVLRTLDMQIECFYAVHVATLFIPKEFPRNRGGATAVYLRSVEWLDRRLSRSFPFFYLGGSIIVVGRKL
jgi:ubiquinone/menaquinone biosynthesis C-methylase UbiE